MEPNSDNMYRLDVLQKGLNNLSDDVDKLHKRIINIEKLLRKLIGADERHNTPEVADYRQDRPSGQKG